MEHDERPTHDRDEPAAARPATTSGQDEHLRPTPVTTAAPTGTSTTGPTPWRTGSILAAAFFGGALTAGVLGVLQARRLGADQRTTALVGATGLAVFGGWLAYVLVWWGPGHPSMRISVIGAGLIASLIVQRLLQRPTQVFERSGQQPSSMWVAGILAALGGTAVAGIVLSLAGASLL